jgi:autoinducer 2-degrading protein
MTVILLVARYDVQPGYEEMVAAALREMAPHVAAEEPGCLVYEAHQSQDDPQTFLLYEVYRDEAALAEHRSTAHFARIIEGQVVPRLRNRERQLYTPVTPLTGGRGAS